MSFSEGRCLVFLINSYLTHNNPYDKIEAGLLPEYGTYHHGIASAHASRNGHFDLVRYFMKKKARNNFTSSLIGEGVSRFGNRELFYEVSLDLDADPIENAIKGENLSLVRELTEVINIRPRLIIEGIGSPNDEISKYFLNLIPEKVADPFFYNSLLTKAIENKKTGLIKMFTPLIIDNPRSNIGYIYAAIKSLDKDLFHYYLDRYGSMEDLEMLAGFAIRKRNEYATNFLYKKYRELEVNLQSEWYYIISSYIRVGNISKVAELTGENSSTTTPQQWSSEIFTAVESGNLKMVEYVMDQCINYDEMDNDLNTAIDEAINIGRLDIIRYLSRFTPISSGRIKLMEDLGMIWV